jgi:hypothetical protein
MEKYKDSAQPRIYNIIHNRACIFYDIFKTIPKFIPITLPEYHEVEMAMGYETCVCEFPALRKKRKLSYDIGKDKILLVVMDDIAQGMNPDSQDAMRLIHRLN